MSSIKVQKKNKNNLNLNLREFLYSVSIHLTVPHEKLTNFLNLLILIFSMKFEKILSFIFL